MNPRIEEQLRERVGLWVSSLHRGFASPETAAGAIMEDVLLAHEVDAVLRERQVYVDARGETEPDAKWHAAVAADKYPLPSRTVRKLREEPVPGIVSGWTYRWNPEEGRLESRNEHAAIGWDSTHICAGEVDLMRHALDLYDRPYTTEEVPVNPDNLWGEESAG